MRHKTHERFVQAVIARSALYDEAGVVHGRTVYGSNDGIQKTASMAPPFWIASCRALLAATAECARNDNL
jgi:hypothetical protein